MTTLDDFGPLPTIPPDASPARQQAWRLMRELRAQRRVSTIEAMVIITALSELPAEADPAVSAVSMKSAEAVTAADVIRTMHSVPDPAASARLAEHLRSGGGEHWILGFIRDVERSLTSKED